MPYTPLSTANTLQSWRLRINDIDSVKVETTNPTSSGLLAHTGRVTISTNLTVSGNTTVSGFIANGTLGTSGRFLRTNGTTAHWAPLPPSVSTGKAIAMAIVFG